MSRFSPITRDGLIAALAQRIAEVDVPHPVRVGVDGPHCANLAELAGEVSSQLERAGRPCALVPATGFYRDASLRLEYGRHDVESFYRGWLDVDSLRREVLTPLAAARDWHYLPSLRDPVTNRSTRQPAQPVPLRAVLLVVGELLLGVGLDFDLSVHAAVSRTARRRQTPPELQWTLPAFDRYDIDVDPGAVADLVVRYDDPHHPALSAGR